MRCYAFVALIFGSSIVAAAPETAQQLIEQLGHADKAKRQEATRRLEALGKPALDALNLAVKSHPDPDVRLRAGLLVSKLSTGGRGLELAIENRPGYWLNRVLFLPDGKHAVASGGGVLFYDLSTRTKTKDVVELEFARPGLCLTMDGKALVTGHQTDKAVRVLSVETGDEMRAFTGHTAGISAVALCPDGELASSGSEDGTVHIWDVRTCLKLRSCKDVPTVARCLTFAPEGGSIAAAFRGPKADFKIRTYSAVTGGLEVVLEGHTAEVSALAYLPDGKVLASAGMDGTLRFWDIASAKELRRVEHKGGIRDLALSPDGKQLLTAGYEDHILRLWDVCTCKEVYASDKHTGRVLSCAFSPDGRRAASGDSNGTLRIWRLVP